jgi:hypothetical protein
MGGGEKFIEFKLANFIFIFFEFMTGFPEGSARFVASREA